MFRTFWQKIREPYRSEERKTLELCILLTVMPILLLFSSCNIHNYLDTKQRAKTERYETYDTYYAKNLEFTYSVVSAQNPNFLFKDKMDKKYIITCEDNKCRLPRGNKGAKIIGENIYYYIYNNDRGKSSAYVGYLLSGRFYLKDKPQHTFEIIYNPNMAYTFDPRYFKPNPQAAALLLALALLTFILPIPIIFRLKFDFSYMVGGQLAILYFCVHIMTGLIEERNDLLAKQEKATDIIAKKIELPDTTRYHYIPAKQFEGRPRYSHVKFDYQGHEYTVLCGMMKEFLDEALCDDKEKILSGKQVVFFENNKTNTGLLLNAELKDYETEQEYHIHSNQEDIDHFLFSQFYYSKRTLKINLFVLFLMILGVIWSVISIFRLCLKTYKGDEI